MKKIIFALACFCSFLAVTTFTSCKKDPIITTKDDLQDFKWRLTAQTINGNDNFSKITVCNQDNITIYKADGSWIEDQGVVKCPGSTETQTTMGSWTVTGDSGKTLTLIDALTKKNAVFTILELTETALKIENTQTFNNVPITLVNTFVREK